MHYSNSLFWYIGRGGGGGGEGSNDNCTINPMGNNNISFHLNPIFMTFIKQLVFFYDEYGFSRLELIDFFSLQLGSIG